MRQAKRRPDSGYQPSELHTNPKGSRTSTFSQDPFLRLLGNPPPVSACESSVATSRCPFPPASTRKRADARREAKNSIAPFSTPFTFVLPFPLSPSLLPSLLVLPSPSPPSPASSPGQIRAFASFPRVQSSAGLPSFPLPPPSPLAASPAANQRAASRGSAPPAVPGGPGPAQAAGAEGGAAWRGSMGPGGRAARSSSGRGRAGL